MSAFVPEAAREPAPNRDHGFWRRRSLRWQVMVAVVAINLCAALAALLVVIVNARRATEAEMTASLVVAERLVEETVQRLASSAGGEASLAQLPLHISGLRHVRIAVEDLQGRIVDIAPKAAERDGDHEAVPGWFAALVTVDAGVRDVPVVEGGRVVGHVRVAGEASDEVAEVWSDTSDLAVLALGVNIAVLSALYLVLGRLLRPLQTLSVGLSQLEAGNFAHRLPRPDVRELAHIADRFNALGAALNAARADNARLNERVIHVQDDERRQIASDLHDELGPCLFGLRANLESVQRLAGRTEPDLGRRIGERTGTMAEILDRVQGLNRRLLRQLRPMALGHVPLAAVIGDLVADFESHSPEHRFHLTVEDVAERYPDSVELTVYRCLREAATNALRHGGARNISIALRGAEGELRLTVEDDGVGMAPGAAPGLGLTGIGERLSALGGSWQIVPAAAGGTRVEMVVPVMSVMTDTTGTTSDRVAAQ